MITGDQTALDALPASLEKAAAYNRNIQVTPAVVLWPDHGRQWAPLVPALRAMLPQLLTLGEYDPAARTGPATWIKCMIARTLPEAPAAARGTPVPRRVLGAAERPRLVCAGLLEGRKRRPRPRCRAGRDDSGSDEPSAGAARRHAGGEPAGAQARGIGLRPPACCYDEAYTLPSERTQRVSLHTMQILVEEMGLTDTVDPLAGSYYVETLTNQMEAEIRRIMAELEARGGVVAQIASGELQAHVSRQAYKRQRRLEAGELRKVGVNCYRVEHWYRRHLARAYLEEALDEAARD